MAETVIQWEEAVDKVRKAGYRATSNRIGLVLAKEGGVLEEMTKTFKFGIAGYFGSGNQYYPWVHVEDVCRLFLFQLENENVDGIFNACSPNPVTMKALLVAAKKAMKSRAIMLPVPKLILNIMIGEMADVITHSQRVIPEATIKSGFEFMFPDVESAMADLT